jgi:hypothetical protein
LLEAEWKGATRFGADEGRTGDLIARQEQGNSLFQEAMFSR